MMSWNTFSKRIPIFALALLGAFVMEVPAAEVECQSVPGCNVASNSSDQKKNNDLALSTLIPAPPYSEQAAYLGIEAESDAFKLADVKADVLIVFVFDMYCHACAQSTPNMRRLEKVMSETLDARAVRAVGLGRGDNQFEAESFAIKHDLEFPVFSDKDRQLSNALGVRVTPSGFAFIRNADGDYELGVSFTGYLSKLKLEAFSNQVKTLLSK